jgi:hypothetical protein
VGASFLIKFRGINVNFSSTETIAQSGCYRQYKMAKVVKNLEACVYNGYKLAWKVYEMFIFKLLITMRLILNNETDE